MPERKHSTIGVDIGGTKVAAGIVDAEGEITFKTRRAMLSSGGAAQGFACVQIAIDAVFEVYPEARELRYPIGICAPGPLDPRSGVVLNPPHLPCWRNFPLAEEVERSFGVPVRVDNDANAAGLAEALWGAGRGYENVFYATLGTGVGTGIVFNRHIYYGRTGAAAEGGHMSIDYRGPRCGCGKRGCLDVLCSGPGIAQRARDKISGWADGSRILALAGSIDRILAEHVGQAFSGGDVVARDVLRETADLLAVWFGNIVDLLEPDVMVVGGGVADLMSPFFRYITEELPHWSINPRASEIPLLRARYGADAGIAGAAALVADVSAGLADGIGDLTQDARGHQAKK
jgi:glucokinase